MLSDAEQQRLTEIESGLQADDPVFVRRFDDGPKPQRRWPRWAMAPAAVVAVLAAAIGLVVGSVGVVVVALTAVGVTAGMWITHRHGG